MRRVVRVRVHVIVVVHESLPSPKACCDDARLILLAGLNPWIGWGSREFAHAHVHDFMYGVRALGVCNRFRPIDGNRFAHPPQLELDACSKAIPSSPLPR